MPRINSRWISFFAFCAAVLITLVTVVGWESFKEGTKNRDKFNSYGIETLNESGFTTNWTETQTIAMLFTIDSFDPNKFGTAIGFHIDYVPVGDLISQNSSDLGLRAPAVPVRMLLHSATFNFAAEAVMAPTTVSLILDGDVNRYPFDVFSFDYEFYAFTSPSNGSYGSPMPISAFTIGTVQGFKIDTSFQGLEDDGSGVKITFTVRRSPITKIFAIIIGLVMWCLSSAVFIAAMSVFFRERKVEPPLIAISTAVLFALPNIRNSQPGIPSTAGTTSDMVGFFWNLLLVAVSAFSLLLNYIIKSRREHRDKLPV